mgnify:CR=1 FL=1|tara:strand:- start:35 stop:1237 length:1203 start_codon:yes stop_codon:yes gene_type:complete
MKKTHLILILCHFFILGCETQKQKRPKTKEVNYRIKKDSLRNVFNNMNDEKDYYYTKDKWVIHDPSKIVNIENHLMIGVTGKAQEDGYKCGLETWYLFPGESKFTPGQCLLKEKPKWIKHHVPTNDGAFWAPGFLDSRTMYYSVPSGNAMEEGEGTDSCIGLVIATGSPPNLIWKDYGRPITCTEKGEDNKKDPEPESIDPAIFIDDDGKNYLIYGGGHIWLTELDKNKGEQIHGDHWALDSEDYTLLANGPQVDEEGNKTNEEMWIEAAYMFKKGSYYYLFANWYNCCKGVDSTYEIRVGRSKSLRGPFVDSKGRSMIKDGAGELILDKSSGLIGPGHVGIYSFKNNKGIVTDLFTFHYYPKSGVPWASMKVRKLSWEKGWPIVSKKDFDFSSYWPSVK